ncbi:hypothetical protein CQA49_00040 [Helicobacter sp. MIT 00-7814]|uniref:hypothetical protein n=1 Tax=unclassified Helicobacter TaxID=2593540 RepID=UPI000E1F9E9F|nr:MULTISPECIES: hypothetical protein [unclassified Helicobacter]RDU57094.1 hypothetical protein CQA49_00040 [Helicobacter sp. MIT 00-7814]RDU57645.1 hypothetical protein CQA37_00040 [Helicobacter sp. MIT 99-10781]
MFNGNLSQNYFSASKLDLPSLQGFGKANSGLKIDTSSILKNNTDDVANAAGKAAGSGFSNYASGIAAGVGAALDIYQGFMSYQNYRLNKDAQEKASAQLDIENDRYNKQMKRNINYANEVNDSADDYKAPSPLPTERH